MYIPNPPARPVRLWASDGTVYEYASLTAFVEAHGLYWVQRSLGPGFRVCGCATPCRVKSLCPSPKCYPFVLRDHAGEVISVETCEAEWRRLQGPCRWRYGRYRFWNGKGPVPYTGKLGGGHYHRRVRTFPEHRACEAVLTSEGEPRFRAARNRHNLPSAWDDIRITARYDRSWKRHRKTQYKQKKEPPIGGSSRGTCP